MHPNPPHDTQTLQCVVNSCSPFKAPSLKRSLPLWSFPWLQETLPSTKFIPLFPLCLRDSSHTFIMEGVAFVICVSGHFPDLPDFQGGNWVSVTPVSWHLTCGRAHTRSISSRVGVGYVSSALWTEQSCALNNMMPGMLQGLPSVSSSLRRGQLQGDQRRASGGAWSAEPQMACPVRICTLMNYFSLPFGEVRGQLSSS